MSLLAATQQKKALDLVAQAEAAVNKRSWLFGSNKERNQEEGAELYMQAANAYKVGGFNHEAGTTYVTAAAIYRDALKNANEASKCYSQAGSCFKKSNPSDAVEAFGNAVTLLIDAGRLSQAAKLSKECAELYETEEMQGGGGGEKSHVVLAIEAYTQASDLFDMENSKAQANACLVKVAELCSAALEPPDLTRAAQLYDQLGRSCLDSNLLKFNAKGYFLQSILCHLAQTDAIGAEQALSKYEGVDYTFAESREGKFSRQLVDCVNGMDAEAFATACFEYDRISKLDPWKTSMLVKVKRSLQDEDENGNGEDEDVDLT